MQTLLDHRGLHTKIGENISFIKKPSTNGYASVNILTEEKTDGNFSFNSSVLNKSTTDPIIDRLLNDLINENVDTTDDDHTDYAEQSYVYYLHFLLEN